MIMEKETDETKSARGSLKISWIVVIETLVPESESFAEIVDRKFVLLLFPLLSEYIISEGGITTFVSIQLSARHLALNLVLKMQSRPGKVRLSQMGSQPLGGLCPG